MICRQLASRGMNNCPTAYSPGSGSVKPRRLASLAKNLCGICTRMPAPSPMRGSAPVAPRCSRLQRMRRPSWTIKCDLRPLISAMKPTPQESLSSAGSYRPAAAGTPGSAVEPGNGAKEPACQATSRLPEPTLLSSLLISPCLAAADASALRPSAYPPDPQGRRGPSS